MNYKVRKVTDADRGWVQRIVRGWGADFIVSRGRKVYPADIEGYVAEDGSGSFVGLLTYEVTGAGCEVVTLDALTKFRGIGTLLMDVVENDVSGRGCSRLWLITTNDNLDAIRFYYRRGFSLAAVHIGALEISRKLKPSIPAIGQYGIPLSDEFEFEKILGKT